MTAAIAAYLLQRYVGEQLRRLLRRPAGLTLFPALPVALTVADGVVKAVEHCDLGDLGAGLAYRQENLRRAQDKFNAYVESMARFELLRERDDETVGEVVARLRTTASAA